MKKPKSMEDAIRDNVALLVSEIMNEVFDNTSPDSRVNVVSGGIKKTGHLILHKNKVNYFRRLKNKDWKKWNNKHKKRLQEITQTILEETQ